MNHTACTLVQRNHGHLFIDEGVEAVEVLDRDGLDDFRVHGDDAGDGAVVAAVRLAEPPELLHVVICFWSRFEKRNL